MTLWIAICPYDTHFFKLWSRLRLPIQCVIPYVIGLQAPSLVWYTCKTLRHPPPKRSEPHASCNFQAQPPQQQLHLPNQHLLTCPIPLICRPIKSNLVLTQEYSAVVYFFIFIRSQIQKYYIFALLLFHCRSRQFNFVAFNHKPLGQNMHPKACVHEENDSK